MLGEGWHLGDGQTEVHIVQGHVSGEQWSRGVALLAIHLSNDDDVIASCHFLIVNARFLFFFFRRGLAITGMNHCHSTQLKAWF